MSRRPRATVPKPMAIAAVRRIPHVLVVAALLLAGMYLAGPASAASEPMSYCSTTRGVVVAVDFSHWGGPVVRGCGTTPTTGFQLVNEGGFATTGTQHDGAGFVCRIASSSFGGGVGYPTTREDACVVTPPSTAYWAYWHAAPGSSTWTYSSLGATSYQPQPGSVDLWTFGGTGTDGSAGSATPAFSPAAVRASNATATSPPSTPSAAGVGAGGSGGGGGPAQTPGPSVGASSPQDPAPAARSSAAAPGRAATPSSDTSRSSGLTGDAARTPVIVNGSSARPHAASGALSATGPAIIALIVVLVVGAAAIWIVLRRRRAD